MTECYRLHGKTKGYGANLKGIHDSPYLRFSKVIFIITERIGKEGLTENCLQLCQSQTGKGYGRNFFTLFKRKGSPWNGMN